MRRRPRGRRQVVSQPLPPHLCPGREVGRQRQCRLVFSCSRRAKGRGWGRGGTGESEAMESASAAETGSAEESGSESTLTDSSPEDGGTVSAHSSLPRPWKRRASSSASPSHSNQTGSDKGAFDIFISAAEALNNIVPPEIALHDHNYALAPLNSVDLQGTSGLSLIAAAAAVVSPTLSRSAGSGKFPAVSPVRAPRGRPPNTQRRGSGGSSCKLSPAFLSPAGSSIYVPLTDTTKSSFRSRARSAPSDRPRLQLRAGPSNLRYSISSKSGNPRPILPPASYTRGKDSPGAGQGGSPSLKSMIASRPQHGNPSNAAFETLVNVAVAASPAELPKTTPTQQPTATLSISFQNASLSSAPSTPASEGTYSIDMNQAMINILSLAQLTQGPASSSSATTGKTTQQLLLTPGIGSQASGFLGTIVSQSNHNSATGAGKSPSPSTVNVLIGHLTSGAASPSPSTGSESSTSSRGSPAVPPDPKPLQRPLSGKTSSSSKPPTTVGQSSNEDLSNLNLLSSLVAVVAGSQTTPPHSSHPQHTSTTSTRSNAPNYSFAKTPAPNFSPLTVSSVSTPKSSPFKATNLPVASSSSAKQKENCTRTKIQEKSSPNLSSLMNSDHNPRSSSLRGTAANSSPLDNLARSVVRSSSLTHPQSSLTTTNSSHSHPTLPTVPSPSPSISQQSTLLLYTRSLSLPNSSAVDPSSEEEDHLESATRGISELSKLLGTDTEPLGSSDSTTTSYRNSWADQPLPTASLHTSRTPRGSSKAELGNDSSKYLSGLLESHSSHTHHPQKTGSTNTDVNSSHNLSR
ncbi:hypothetical protein GBAR_LOCUS31529 [Geodia barretti]|uniref:Uncharacterized protein n=1 Tax=Geodia barretti TaxID=519541 RepID=A0AA35U138_GEOBA|nr:hypothetical protein GBAR_LOCUS31529 [Geodia barretti]